MSKTCSLQAGGLRRGGWAAGPRLGQGMGSSCGVQCWGPPHPRPGKIDEAGLGVWPPRLGKPITAEVFYHCHGGRGELPAPAGNSPLRSKAAEGDKWGLLKWAGGRGAAGAPRCQRGDGGKGTLYPRLGCVGLCGGPCPRPVVCWGCDPALPKRRQEGAQWCPHGLWGCVTIVFMGLSCPPQSIGHPVSWAGRCCQGGGPIPVSPLWCRAVAV